MKKSRIVSRNCRLDAHNDPAFDAEAIGVSNSATRPETSPRNTRLSDAQGRALRARGEANGLLTGRGR